MFRSGPALTAVTAAVVLFGACSPSPTAPTPATGSVVVGSLTQEPTSTPQSIIPNVPPVLGATRFVAFGDSITCGVESLFDSLVTLPCPSDTAGYPERLRNMLGTYAPGQTFFVTKRGYPGEWALDGEARLRAELSEMMSNPTFAARPQGLLLLEGINDMNGGTSATRAAASLAQLAQIGRLYNLRVLVATMPQTYVNTMSGGSNSADKVVAFNDEVKRLLNGLQNVQVVDLFAAFGSNRALIGGDGLHPTPAGYDVMAQHFHAAIVQAFPVRGSLQ
jgi:lysophospholipase L1-like esterase